jgi:hypothetical protein
VLRVQDRRGADGISVHDGLDDGVHIDGITDGLANLKILYRGFPRPPVGVKYQINHP